MRLLIAQSDEQPDNELKRRLIEEGFTVDFCTDGEDALARILMGCYDAAVLDILLPNMDGTEILRRMRTIGMKTPVLFLTEISDIEEKVRDLNLGANDYMVKPASYDELVARIYAVTRGTNEQLTDRYKVGDVTLNTHTHTVTRGGKMIALTRTEYAILEYLVANQGQVLSRERIASHVWGTDHRSNDTEIEVYISYIRKKLEDKSHGKMIHTVRGVGYLMRAPEHRQRRA